MPDIHACYQCLLGQGETELLGEMHTLVLLRRALSIILTEGFQNRIPVFAQKLRKQPYMSISYMVANMPRLQWEYSHPDHRSS